MVCGKRAYAMPGTGAVVLLRRAHEHHLGDPRVLHAEQLGGGALHVGVAPELDGRRRVLVEQEPAIAVRGARPQVEPRLGAGCPRAAVAGAVFVRPALDLALHEDLVCLAHRLQLLADEHVAQDDILRARRSTAGGSVLQHVQTVCG